MECVFCGASIETHNPTTESHGPCPECDRECAGFEVLEIRIPHDGTPAHIDEIRTQVDFLASVVQREWGVMLGYRNAQVHRTDL